MQVKLIVIDIQKGITDERLYDYVGFLQPDTPCPVHRFGISRFVSW